MIPVNNIHKAATSSGASSADFKLSKYSILANIYFFFNSVLLPKGLLYTHILSPVVFYNVIKNRRKTGIVYFGSFLLVYDCIHLHAGVDLQSFTVSNLLFISTYFCVVAFYHFVNNYDHLPKIFRQILLFNACLVFIAIVFYFFGKQYQQWFWYFNKLTLGIADFPRLALFTYEASYYSLLLIPVFYYYLFKLIFNTISHNKWLTVFLICLPMLLSFSFGVMGTALLSGMIMCMVFWKKMLRFKKAILITGSILLFFFFIILLLFVYFPQNFFLIRIENILSGKDTSANGRTIDSFTMAWRIAALNDLYFGAGLGQIKIQAVEVAHKYYSHWGLLPRYDIPNTLGETLAIFGLVGVAIRILLECWLFFKTKVYKNYYRLALFVFIFIYQFTGSFITNIVEYVIWILAFSPIFEQFNIKNKQDATLTQEKIKIPPNV